jgi:hypothetical protein
MVGRRRAVISTDDVEIGVNLGRAPEELREAGVEVDDIDIVPAHKMHSKAEEAKFMEEKVIVEIEGDDDPNAPVFVFAGHNGVSQYVERGKPQVIKRKYLYSMLAAKRVKFACAFGKDGNGNEFNRLNGNGQTAHRVRLVRDDNPLGGMKWFQAVAAAA